MSFYLLIIIIIIIIIISGHSYPACGCHQTVPRFENSGECGNMFNLCVWNYSNLEAKAAKLFDFTLILSVATFWITWHFFYGTCFLFFQHLLLERVVTMATLF